MPCLAILSIKDMMLVRVYKLWCVKEKLTSKWLLTVHFSGRYEMDVIGFAEKYVQLCYGIGHLMRKQFKAEQVDNQNTNNTNNTNYN